MVLFDVGPQVPWWSHFSSAGRRFMSSDCYTCTRTRCSTTWASGCTRSPVAFTTSVPLLIRSCTTWWVRNTETLLRKRVDAPVAAHPLAELVRAAWEIRVQFAAAGLVKDLKYSEEEAKIASEGRKWYFIAFTRALDGVFIALHTAI